MKLYLVKPEYLYGETKEEKRKLQLEALTSVGVEEIKKLEGAVCTAEQAFELFSKGYCGSYIQPDDVIQLYDTKSDIDIEAVIRSSISSNADALLAVFDKYQSKGPVGELIKETDIGETMIKVDCCTDVLQEALSNGWRILAVCPQEGQRRPDYILGRRKALPKMAAR